VHPEQTLASGEFIEFEATEDFTVRASEAISVGQFLVGQQYAGIDVARRNSGDPGFALVTPADQYRRLYNFLAPATYTENWITVVAPVGARVELDGRALPRGSPIGSTDMQAIRVEVSSGSHNLRSQERFGVTVYGFGSFTSYMYAAGLDFQRITPVR
jgi:hypothetical protein